MLKIILLGQASSTVNHYQLVAKVLVPAHVKDRNAEGPLSSGLGVGLRKGKGALIAKTWRRARPAWCHRARTRAARRGWTHHTGTGISDLSTCGTRVTCVQHEWTYNNIYNEDIWELREQSGIPQLIGKEVGITGNSSDTAHLQNIGQLRHDVLLSVSTSFWWKKINS